MPKSRAQVINLSTYDWRFTTHQVKNNFENLVHNVSNGGCNTFYIETIGGTIFIQIEMSC